MAPRIANTRPSLGSSQNPVIIEEQPTTVTKPTIMGKKLPKVLRPAPVTTESPDLPIDEDAEEVEFEMCNSGQMQTYVSSRPIFKLDPNDPSVPGPHCVFFTMPNEIREMVYELVYGQPQSFKLQSRYDWRRRRDARNDRKLLKAGTTQPPPLPDFPESPVADLLVNKQYFAEACRVWVQSKIFSFCDSHALSEVFRYGTELDRYMVSCIKSTSHDEYLSSSTEEAWMRLPCLKEVQCCIDPEWFEGPGPSGKLPWLDQYTDLEISQLNRLNRLLRLRGLRKIVVHWSPCRYATSPEEKACWETLKVQVETLLRDVVTQPRERSIKQLSSSDFYQALARTMGTKSAISTTSAASSPSASQKKPLLDNEVPKGEDGLLRLFLTRPAAFSDWVEEIKQRAGPKLT